MLYRPGSACRVWNLHDVDTLIVGDQEDENEAKRQGWSEHPASVQPLDHDRDGRNGGSLPRRKRKPE